MISNLPNISRGSTANPSTYNIVTTEEAATLMPTVIPQLTLSYGNGLMLLSDVFTYAFPDRSELIANSSWSAWQENYPITTMTISSSVTVSSTPGGTATFTLDSTDLDAYNHSYPRQYQACLFGTPGDQIEGRIQSITKSGATHTVVVAPNGLETLSATYIYAGAVIPLGGIKTSVEAAATTPTRVSYDHVDFYMQVNKEAQGWGGGTLAQQKWFDMDGMHLLSHDTARKEFELKAGMNFDMWVGQAVTNPLIVNTSALDGSTSIPAQSSIGLWTWGDTKGWDSTYSTSAGWKVTDLDVEGEYYQSMGIGTTDILWTLGGGLYTLVENGSVGYITNATGALSDLFLSPGDEKDLSIGFKSIFKNGYRYHMRQDPTWNNPKLLKNHFYTAGCKFPMSTVRQKDGSGVPNIAIKYRGLGGYNRKMIVGKEIGMDGGYSIDTPALTHTGDYHQVHWMSEWGLQVLDAFGIIRNYGV